MMYVPDDGDVHGYTTGTRNTRVVTSEVKGLGFAME